MFAAAIGLFILPRAWRLGRRTVRVLVQGAPEALDLDEMQRRLEAVEAVEDVHDFHVWTLTSEMPVSAVHLMEREGTDPHPILDQARSVLRDLYGISHATLQVEPESHIGCAEVTR